MCLLHLKDELLGLIEEPGKDPIYKNPSLDMDVLYRVVAIHQGYPISLALQLSRICALTQDYELCNHSISETFAFLGLAYMFQLAYVNLLNSKVSLYSFAPNSPVSNAFHEHNYLTRLSIDDEGD
ncbi:hypothetical protein GIB67_014012 [Kingdonia uniflora]|uniref:Uncharacterized protein n=1 Tax=Kingdonia uniflora TaxID=39325 RepID=A0A7J7L5M3_9MAGN|nr:hypothetical protein GIB67_014012 [Kingdonia uniflora]